MELPPKKPEFSTVDEYIQMFPKETQEILEKIRAVIRKAAPLATEKISWQMPTFWQKENLVHFAVHKTHIGFYPGADGVAEFAHRFPEYKSSKGAIQFPLSKPIPYDLIEEITRFKVAEGEKRHAGK